LVRTGLVVALIFCIVMLLSICAAHLYGVFFVITLAPDTSDPFYLMPFVWAVAAAAAVIAGAIAMMNRGAKATR
jgi:hypothetical protein